MCSCGGDSFRPFICLWGQPESKPVFLFLMLGLEKGGESLGLWHFSSTEVITSSNIQNQNVLI